MTTELDQLVHESVKDGSVRARFSPKMNRNQRCCALGLMTLGYSPAVIASMYNIHSRTASQIARKSSLNYREVRVEMETMGRDAFIERYVTRDDVSKANYVVSMTLRESPAQPTSSITVDNKKPNPRSSGREGTFAILGRRVTISWAEGESTGWFYVDESDPATAYGPFPHSKAAYDQAVIDIGAMI